ncbi:MAG: glycosyltransferase [Bacilli bacterium]|nr:glycosyltransferase [Bacilli bacterium]
MVKVSVIVPIYNSGVYLKKCIDSLVNQTLKDIEIILINDGSTDNSEDIIKGFSDKRIKYYKRSNHGIGATRNFGIDKACGEFIGFVDSDDYISLDMYEKMYNECISNNLDVVVCDFYQEKNDIIDVIKFNNFGITTLCDSPNLLLDLNLSPWNKIYRRSLFDNKTYFPVNVKYEDTPFVAYMLYKAQKIGKIDLPLYHYLIHSNSETTVVDNRVYDIFKITDLIIDNLNDDKIRESVDDLVIYLITKYTISMRYIKNKKFRHQFIDDAFNYLDKKIPCFRDSNYFKNRNKLKGIIEKSELLSKIYCDLYELFKK